MNNADLIRRWKPALDAAKNIFTWTEPLSLAWLAEQASKSTFAIECGVYMGHSSKVMLAANPNLHLWAVDLFMVEGTKKVAEYFMAKEIADGRLEIIPKSSPAAAEMLTHMMGQIDLCFIDGGHDTETVSKDIRSFLPLLRKGGVLCGHDLDQNPDNDVTQGVKQSLPSFTEPVPRMWMYIKP